MRGIAVFFAGCLACGGPAAIDGGPPGPIPPGEDSTRDVLSTDLAIDVTAHTGTARITLAPSTSMAASFEIGDLAIRAVRSGGGSLEHADRGDRLDIGVPATTEPLVVEIEYEYSLHGSFMGADPGGGFTLLWPYYCGNLFPCRSTPADGTTFALALTGVPAGMTAVYPATIPGDAPAYQIAWAIGDYVRTDVGTTAGGTHLSAWHRASDASAAAAGTANLRAAFEWLETTLGPYRFGTEAGTVAVDWGGGYGGMEHHPIWHVSAPALGDESVQVHEASHGWFGDGIRLACWEDIVLSEGTATYLAARVLDVVAPAVGAAVWDAYASELAIIPGELPVWPDSCGAVDILTLFSRAPYMRGAYFYRAVALRVGGDALDRALHAVYMQYAGRAARMSDVVRVIGEETGFDATSCANAWLRSTTIPAVGPCP